MMNILWMIMLMMTFLWIDVSYFDDYDHSHVMFFG